MVEASIKEKLTSFPKQSNKDTIKLYELADILSEVESLKEDTDYGLLLSYYDTSAGINPIVAKLQTGLQEKWTNHAVKYITTHDVHFPPFSEFAQFIRNTIKIKNNPCFMYGLIPTVAQPQTFSKDKTAPTREQVSFRKTEVTDRLPSKTSTADKSSTLTSDKSAKEDRCPIQDTKHTLAVCRTFGSKPISERRQVLNRNGGCYRCFELVI